MIEEEVESLYRATLPVGKALFDACRAFVQENGYAFMEWVTADDNVHSQTFYERQGAQKSSWIVYSV